MIPNECQRDAFGTFFVFKLLFFFKNKQKSFYGLHVMAYLFLFTSMLPPYVCLVLIVGMFKSPVIIPCV